MTEPVHLVLSAGGVRVADIECGNLQAFDFERANSVKGALIERGRDACREMLTDFFRLSAATDDAPGHVERPKLSESDDDGAETEGCRRLVTFNTRDLTGVRDQVFLVYAREPDPFTRWSAPRA